MARAKKKASTRQRKATRKALARKRKPRVLVSIVEASVTRRASVFRAFRKVLKDHGLSDQVITVQLDPVKARAVAPVAEATAGVAAAAAAEEGPCPPGHVVRIVCEQRADGTIVCEPRCQPL